MARAMPYGDALHQCGPNLSAWVEQRRRERGDHLITFAPNAKVERFWWLVILASDVERSLRELLYWTLARLDLGTIVVYAVDPAVAGRILNQPVLFEDGPATVGDRFVVYQPEEGT